MFILAFILSLLNINPILSGASSGINEDSVKNKIGESIPETYVCDYYKLDYNQIPGSILPPGAPFNATDKNNVIQNKVYIKKFIEIHGDSYRDKKIFEEIYKHVKNVIVSNVTKLFSLTDEENKEIIIECPIKIPDNPKKDEFQAIFKNEDKEENIFNIFKQYLQIEDKNMSYLYLQKKITNDPDIRKKNYKKIPDEFDFNDYKGKTILVILNLESQEYVFLAPI